MNDNLIKWFNNIFNSCYYVKHDDYPDSIFMYYDIRYIRKLKLSLISGKSITPPKSITGVCMFEQDWKFKRLWCNYNEIWKYLKDNYSNDYNDIQKFIKDRLEEHSKLNVLTPFSQIPNVLHPLEEHSKLNVLTPNGTYKLCMEMLGEHSKLNVLTPQGWRDFSRIEEHSKLNILTPKV